MLSEIVATIASLALNLFIISSMLAMGMSLTHASSYSLMILIVAALLLQFRNIIGAIGSWVILATLLLVAGAVVVGYVLSIGSDPATRRVAALGAGQRNLSAALLVGAGLGSPETLVMTLVAALILQVVMLVVAGEIGKRQQAPAAVPAHRSV